MPSILRQRTPSPPIDEDGVQGGTRNERAAVYEKKSSKSGSFFKSAPTPRKRSSSKGGSDGAGGTASPAAPPQSGQLSAYDRYPAISRRPEPFDRALWSEPSGRTFSVRGRNYLSDRVKVPSDDGLFRLITADILEVTSVLPRGGSVCLHENGRVQTALRAEERQNGDAGPRAFPPFLFCVNIRIPHPTPGREYHIAAYYAVDDLSTIDGSGDCPSSKLARRFFFGTGNDDKDDDDDDFRDGTFKLVPRIVEGNPLIKKAVGSKPVIMGRKLKQSYVRGERFFELIIDVGSDKVADKIVKMCIGSAKSIVVDMAFLLEGKDSSVLPERVMGAVRLKNIDFKNQRRVVQV